MLETPIFYTICLLSSSLTVHFAASSERGSMAAFWSLWLLTIVLGGIFSIGTAQEWRRLILRRGLTISTNLFGTTYYSLVGLHAFHVTAGLSCSAIVLVFSLAAGVRTESAERVECFLDVLAFCRCRLGRRFHRGLHCRTLRRKCNAR